MWWFLGIAVAITAIGMLIVNLAPSPLGAIQGSVIATVGLVLLLVCLAIFGVHAAFARDLGQWKTADPEVREWYQALMQPDVPTMSCCGEADAYWCDIARTEVIGDGAPKNYCIITDDRPDGPLGRPHREVGTEIQIPNHKLKYDRGNPTGHAIVFLSRESYVYCYVAPGGV